MFHEIKETTFKEFKESLRIITHQIENINKIEIVK